MMDDKQTLKDKIIEIEGTCISVSQFPDSIYHYTDVNGVYNIINNKCFWLTKSDFLNDERELVYFYDILKNVLEENKFSNINFDFVGWLRAIAHDKLKNTFILSFSTDKDSLPLWEMYANGKGYNIGMQCEQVSDEFWDENIFITNAKNQKIYMTRKNDTGQFCGVSKFVIYDDKIQKDRVKELLDGIDLSIEFIRRYKEDTSACNLVRALECRIASEFINCMMLFKDKSFSYEREFRIVYNIINCDELDIVKYRIKNDIIVPYIELGFEDVIIKSIRLSPRLKNDTLAVKGLNSFIDTINMENTSNIEVLFSQSSIR
ncbi:DUF2971 domain-containing protein [Clostridium fermenticellae]|uniref:DUF2971 domain-containing protein n=1 Tax=Clostridium fermenticellae TaxID=2068654 RepID=A0A386H1H5_9CLOT|nr:DUF2971 domain-containing protein [Clostridium fermenticellae]AYD39516.1 DUF2971 domain-containing protein [Clostridium fermenticellae]